MKPDQALGELVAATAARGALTEGAAPPADLTAGINGSYFLFRRWIAFAALGMPALLWLASIWSAGPTGCVPLVPQPALSNYYHCPGGWLGDVFVGALCVMGFALFCYKGYTLVEDRVLDLAAISAVLVAIAPMAPRGWPDRALPRWFPEPLTDINGFTIGLHGIAALVLFLAVGYVCIFQSRTTLALLNDEAAIKRYRLAYLVLGIAMVALPVTVVLIHLIGTWSNSRVVFFVEYAGVAVFAVYWLVKSREIAQILRQ